jgi:hypothetical protein
VSCTLAVLIRDNVISAMDIYKLNFLLLFLLSCLGVNIIICLPLVKT